jgi:hypothetical protein
MRSDVSIDGMFERMLTIVPPPSRHAAQKS